MKISKKWNKAHVECWFNSPDPGEEFLVLAHIYVEVLQCFLANTTPTNKNLRGNL